METQPEGITVAHLECLIMPNGEIISGGKTLGWFDKLKQDLRPATGMITVEISGGVLVDVKGLPKGYGYDLLDHDSAESATRGAIARRREPRRGDTEHGSERIINTNQKIMQTMIYNGEMKSERAIALILTALAILLALTMFVPRAHASLILGTLTPQSTQMTREQAITFNTAPATTTAPVLITGPLVAVNTISSTLERSEQIKLLQARLAYLRVLLATLAR